MASPAEKRLSVEDRTGLDTYDFGPTAFIKVNTEICKTCETKPCLNVCPAKVYKPDGANSIVYNPEGCMELGACVIVCRHLGKGAIEWSYPEGGKGIRYRYG
ncbi:MAG: 4Fe-4S dicluster domain-containing protein [Methanomassiliicoccales archaeon]